MSLPPASGAVSTAPGGVGEIETSYGALNSGATAAADTSASATTKSDYQQHQQQLYHDAVVGKKLRQWGLLTGIFYSAIIVAGITAEVGIRGNMIDYDDPATTAANIRDDPLKFRYGIALDVVMCCCDIAVCVLLGSVLYAAGASPVLTAASISFRFLQQTVIAANLLNMFAASLLLDDTLTSQTSVKDVIAGNIASLGDGNDDNDVNAALAFMFLSLHKYGYLLALVFFGVSMIIMGIIFVRTVIIPKFLGYMMALAGVAYIVDGCMYFLTSAGYHGQISDVLMIPVFIAEFGFAGWLLFRSPVMSTKMEEMVT